MRLFLTVFVFVLVVVAFLALGHIYLVNNELLNRQVMLFGDHRIRIWFLVLLAFAIGMALNLLLTGILEARRLVRNLNASADNRLGKRISARKQDARELLAHGLFSEARTLLDQILEERPGDMTASLLRAEVFQKQGDMDRAVKHLEGLCLARPELAEPRYLLAEALAAQRNAEGAASLLRQIAGDHPKHALRALRRLRAFHVEAGRWEEALDTQKKLLARFPGELNQAERSQSTALQFQVGLLRVDSDQFKEASQIFQQIIKEDPAFVPAYLSLGRCMILQDQEQQGITLWLEGFRATGEGALLQEVEDFFIQSGRPEEGLALLQRVAANSEFATTARFFLGKMYYRLEILDEALEVFQEVRTQVVYSPILFFFIAKIHARRGRLQQALTEYRQLLRNLGVLKQRFECAACGQHSPDYLDRCDACGSWNSFHFLFRENELPELSLRSEGSSWLGA